MQEKSIISKIRRRGELIGSLLRRLIKERFSEKIKYARNNSIPVIDDFDVVVIGGGISGIVSSLAAARSGARTILIEQQGALGGLATLGLIPPISNQFFDKNGRQVIKGIADEIMTRLAIAGGTVIEWRDWKIPKYPFDIEVFKLIVYELLEHAGVYVMLNTLFYETILEGEKIKFALVENKSGKKAIKGKLFVDCTGDASLAIYSGAPCNINSDLSKPNSTASASKALFKRIGWTERTERSAALQFAIARINFDKFYNYIINNPDIFEIYFRGELKEDIELFKYLWNEKGIFYIPHKKHFKKEIKKAISDNFFKKHSWRYNSLGKCGISMDGLKSNGILTVTANQVAIDPFFDKDITKALIKGQEVCFEIWRFLTEYIPGFENSVLIAVAPLLGIRRAAQIVGNRVFTVEEREQEREYDDVIGIYCRKTSKAREIPYYCLVPQGINNLLLGSGKSVSTDDAVMLRTKSHCMLIGEAAGTAAAICAKKGWSVQNLDIKALQKTLLKQGVYLGDEARLKKMGLM